MNSKMVNPYPSNRDRAPVGPKYMPDDGPKDPLREMKVSPQGEAKPSFPADLSNSSEGAKTAATPSPTKSAEPEEEQAPSSSPPEGTCTGALRRRPSQKSLGSSQQLPPITEEAELSASRSLHQPEAREETLANPEAFGKRGEDDALILPNGDRYYGSFFDARLSGLGTYLMAAGGKYEGQFAHGKFHGVGAEHFPNTATYRGNFAAGARSGYGVCLYANGDVYEGSWKDGLRHGPGMQQCTDDSNYVGEYFEGKRQGFGKYTFPNGDRYQGACHSDLPHGPNQYYFSGGAVHEGSWYEGRKQGYCVYSKGVQQWVGHWADGNPSWIAPLRNPEEYENEEDELNDAEAEAQDLAQEAARVARAAGADAAEVAKRFWHPTGTSQVRLKNTLKAVDEVVAQAQDFLRRMERRREEEREE